MILLGRTGGVEGRDCESCRKARQEKVASFSIRESMVHCGQKGLPPAHQGVFDSSTDLAL